MDEEEPKPKRRGRPPAAEDKKRRHNLTFRIRSDLRDRLESLAKENGRSISEEIENIIEDSLDISTSTIRITHSHHSSLSHDVSNKYEFPQGLPESVIYTPDVDIMQWLILMKISNLESKIDYIADNESKYNAKTLKGRKT